MSKYIIDIPKTVGMGKVGSVHYTYFDGIQCQTIVLKSDEIEELNSDYINEHYGDLQDTAYQRGLEDAWKAAKKIVLDTNHGGIALSDLSKIFGGQSYTYIMNKNTVQEAIAKLKAYEEKQKADDKIVVGDEVIYNNTMKCLVVRPETDERYAVLIDGNGYHHSADHRECKKTGRHFDIASILKEMQS